MEWKNRNIKRNRNYGLRIGDTVELSTFGEKIRAEVVAYGGMDNNMVFVRADNGDGCSVTAEECTLIKKCENEN